MQVAIDGEQGSAWSTVAGRCELRSLRGMICREWPTRPGSARIFGSTRKSRLIRIMKERRSDYSGVTP